MDLKLGVEDMAAFTAMIVINMVEETFENYDLDTCPETVFLTFIYGLIDKWFEKQDRDKADLKEFLETVKTVGTAVYDTEKRGELNV